jgi:hypothetical protein
MAASRARAAGLNERREVLERTCTLLLPRIQRRQDVVLEIRRHGGGGGALFAARSSQ